MDAYADTLPLSLRDTMPSLKDLYDKLSEKIHTANEDAKLFGEARQNIEEHFDIRRVHKLDKRDEERAAPTEKADATVETK